MMVLMLKCQRRECGWVAPASERRTSDDCPTCGSPVKTLAVDPAPLPTHMTPAQRREQVATQRAVKATEEQIELGRALQPRADESDADDRQDYWKIKQKIEEWEIEATVQKDRAALQETWDQMKRRYLDDELSKARAELARNRNQENFSEVTRLCKEKWALDRQRES